MVTLNTVTINRMKAWINGYVTPNSPTTSFQQALIKAHSAFACRHPEWAASLFDEHFLNYTAQFVFQRYINNPASVDGLTLARAWASQLWLGEAKRRELVTELVPAAEFFLNRLASELNAQSMGVRKSEQVICGEQQ